MKCSTGAETPAAIQFAISAGAMTTWRRPQSWAMSSIREGGELGSRGTKTPPARDAPSIAATARPERGRWTPTRSPGATPIARSRFANLFARASSAA